MGFRFQVKSVQTVLNEWTEVSVSKTLKPLYESEHEN